MDRFDAMSVLLAVVDEGNLSAGARRLRLPLTTVSRKVADLEQHLRTRILVRTSRTVTLTDAGRSYVAAARRILEQVEEAERATTGEYSAPRGELAITAPVVFGQRHLMPVVTEFLAAHPEIAIRVLLFDRNLNLVDDGIDLALRIGTLTDSALMVTRIGAIRRIVCAAPGYLARRGVPLTPDDLAGHDLVTFEGYPATSDWRFGSANVPPTAPTRPRLRVNAAEAAVQAALAGLGVTRVFSYQVADEIRSGALRVLLEEHEPEPFPVSFVHPERDLLPLKVRAFLNFAIPRVRERAAAL